MLKLKDIYLGINSCGCLLLFKNREEFRQRHLYISLGAVHCLRRERGSMYILDRNVLFITKYSCRS